MRNITFWIGHILWSKRSEPCEIMDEQEVLSTLFTTLDKLDQERVQYMSSAENYAGHPPSNGIYAWSPMLEKSGRTVTYWKIHRSLMYSTMAAPH